MSTDDVQKEAPGAVPVLPEGLKMRHAAGLMVRAAVSWKLPSVSWRMTRNYSCRPWTRTSSAPNPRRRKKRRQ